jgi:integrase
MTASLSIKKGNYYVVANIYKEGKRKQRWIPTGITAEKGNKRKADTKLREILTELEMNKTDITHEFANITFHEFIAWWLEHIRETIEPNTYESYTTPILKHIIPYFQERKILLKNLSPMHLQDYYGYLIREGRLNGKGGLTAGTVKRHHANISKCLNYAMKQNIIPYTPAQRVELPKAVKFVGSYYNADETQQLLNACKGDPLEPVIILTAFYGLRRSEALGIKWEAIDFVQGAVQVRHTVVKMRNGGYLAKDRTKNASSLRTLPLISIVGEYLQKFKQQQDEFKQLQPNDYVDSGYVCSWHNGELLRPDYVSQHFKLLLKKSGLRAIRFHDLRHSAASNLLAAGFSMKEIQEWLGHADIGTTMNIYAHIDMNMKRNIADKLSKTFVIS